MVLYTIKKKYKDGKTPTGKQLYINKSMYMIECDVCKKEHYRDKGHYKKMKENVLFDKDYCNNCWMKIQNNLPDRKEKNRKAQLMRYANPLERLKTKLASKGNNAGDSNAMKRPEVRAKLSATRRKLMEDPNFRNKFRQPTIDAWKRGAYVGVNASCKWHTYHHTDGTTYKVQGTWELEFIKWLDKNNMNFRCHDDRLKYIDDSNKQHYYYPDFYVYEWDAYVDPKADYWYKKQVRKFELLEEQYPDIEIRILNRQKLTELGIKV